MDIQRLILFIVFSFSVFLLWDAWMAYERPQGPQSGTPGVASGRDESVPAPTAAVTGTPTSIAPTDAAGSTLARGERIQVKTDVYEAEIDLNGGDLRRLVLTRHGSTLDRTQPLVLWADEPPHFYVAQSGLLGEGLPTHKTVYQAAQRSYELDPSAQEVVVRLEWRGEGLEVAKLITFRRSSYLIHIGYELKNGTGQPLNVSSYFQLLRDATPPAGESSLTPTYTGPAWFTQAGKFRKHPFSDVGKDPKEDVLLATDGWIAVLQHYFLSAFLPPEGVQREFYTRKLPGDLYATGVILPIGTVAPGATATVSMPIYAGPQEQATLKELAPGLDLAVDYGLLTVIAAPIFWLLAWIHKGVANWGWAIIILTVLIKLAFYPLSAASYKSMAKMKVLAPRLQRLKEQYGDDRQKLHQAMMELYKTEKINPLGGCLPILIQIPVFIALYWVLLYSVEMRHAPFALWIQDLTAPDPYYVLPVLMGISMYVQAKLNPTPPDPIQAKVMTILPVVFSVFFIFFPAGLVLYWVVNNLLSILQQWRINHVLAQAAKAARR